MILGFAKPFVGIHFLFIYISCWACSFPTYNIISLTFAFTFIFAFTFVFTWTFRLPLRCEYVTFMLPSCYVYVHVDLHVYVHVYVYARVLLSRLRSRSCSRGPSRWRSHLRLRLRLRYFCVHVEILVHVHVDLHVDSDVYVYVDVRVDVHSSPLALWSLALWRLGPLALGVSGPAADQGCQRLGGNSLDAPLPRPEPGPALDAWGRVSGTICNWQSNIKLLRGVYWGYHFTYRDTNRTNYNPVFFCYNDTYAAHFLFLNAWRNQTET